MGTQNCETMLLYRNAPGTQSLKLDSGAKHFKSNIHKHLTLHFRLDQDGETVNLYKSSDEPDDRQV